MKARLIITTLALGIVLIGLRAIGIALGDQLTTALGIEQDEVWWSLLLLSPLILLLSAGISYYFLQNRRLRHRLALEQEFFRRVLQRMPLPVYYKGSGGSYLGGNKALEDFLGIPIDSLVGHKLADFYADKEQAEELAARDAAFLSGDADLEHFEVSLARRRNGEDERRAIINYRARFRNPADETFGIVGVLLDVTDSRLAAQLQAETESRLHKLADHVPGTMFQFQRWPDGSSCFPFASEGLRQLFGIGPEEVTSDSSAIFARAHPDDLDPLDASIRRSAESLKVWQSQHRIIHPSGEVRWISGQAAPELQADGSILWHGYLCDVTEIKKAETAAHQNAELLRAMFENIPDHVYYKDRQSRFLGGNRAWWEERANGLAEVIGKTDADFYSEELAQDLLEGEKLVMETGIAERRREQHEDEDGSSYYLESLKCPFFGPDGSVQGIVGISRDVTEQVELEQNLIRAKEAAEEASVAKSEFLAMMSHEIRTPMNGVIGATSILLNTPLNEEQQEFVRTIQVSGENLLVIINDILDYSKIEADRIELEETEFDLRACIEDALDLFTSSAAEKGIELAFSVDPEVPDRFIGDVTRIRQVLVNLLGNGVKFTEMGEVVLTVSATQSGDDANHRVLHFSVRDTGVGVPEGRWHRLFQAFSQADASNTRRFGGTGLGLVISRRLVEMMGGEIDFKSVEDVGSTFHFTLPLKLAEDAGPRPCEPAPDCLRGKHVLAIDDNQTNRRILSETLNYWGARTTSFESAEALFAGLPQLDPVDAVILDFQMPGMDGVQLAEKLRETSGFQKVPIILLSSVDNSPHSPAIQLRLSKPAKLQSLKRNLERLLESENTRLSTGPTTSPAEPASRSSARILVAEDNTVNQRIAQMMLNRLGYQPVIVSDGEEAVAACAAEEFDLVLMDIQMPRLDGLEATRQIRQQRNTPDHPYILALTAGAMQSDREAAEAAGMNHFLPKPLKLEQLKQAIERALSTEASKSSDKSAAG